MICVPAPVPLEGFTYKPSLNINFPSARIVVVGSEEFKVKLALLP